MIFNTAPQRQGILKGFNQSPFCAFCLFCLKSLRQPFAYLAMVFRGKKSAHLEDRELRPHPSLGRAGALPCRIKSINMAGRRCSQVNASECKWCYHCCHRRNRRLRERGNFEETNLEDDDEDEDEDDSRESEETRGVPVKPRTKTGLPRRSPARRDEDGSAVPSHLRCTFTAYRKLNEQRSPNSGRKPRFYREI